MANGMIMGDCFRRGERPWGGREARLPTAVRQTGQTRSVCPEGARRRGAAPSQGARRPPGGGGCAAAGKGD